jgi:hypothetical protein
MSELRPSTSRLNQLLESTNAGSLEKIVNTSRRHDNIDVLSHAADVTVPPYRPSATDQRLAIACAQNLIKCAHNAPVPARQVLRLQHVVPSSQ